MQWIVIHTMYIRRYELPVSPLVVATTSLFFTNLHARSR